MRMTTTSTSTPKMTRSVVVALAIARLSPSRCGGLIGSPVMPPAKPWLLKIRRRAEAAPSVTTARLTPRSRSAGRPMMMPDRHRAQPGEDQREREADSPAVGDVAEHEAADARRTHLRQRDLTDVAGEQHERQRDAGERHRGDERVAQRPWSTSSSTSPPTKQKRGGAHRSLRARRPTGCAARRLRRGRGPPRERSAIMTMMRMNGSASGQSPLGQPVHTVMELDDLRLRAAEQHAGERDDPEGLEAPDQRDAERRDDEQRVGGRVEVGDRRDEDARHAGEHGGDHLVVRSATRSAEMPISAAPRSFSAPARVASPKRVIAVDQRQRDAR